MIYLAHLFFIGGIFLLQLISWGFYMQPLIWGMHSIYFNEICGPFSLSKLLGKGLLVVCIILLQSSEWTYSLFYLLFCALLMIIVCRYVQMTRLVRFIIIVLFLCGQLFLIEQRGIFSLQAWTIYQIIANLILISLIIKVQVDKTIA